ncbi:MAG TPA: NAD(P)/FAD-dependent oxidoreductase, partial [Candidatus Limnocylindrales bacterium]
MSELGAVVVGGGSAGLAAGYHLGRAGVETVVLERDRIGETWRSQRWDSFVLNTPAWYSRLPGDPEPAAEERDAFLSAPSFLERLEGYAARHGIPVRTGTTVTRVAAADTARGGLVVSVDGPGGSDEFRTASIVVASGILNVPRVPPIAGSLPTGIRQLTVAGYRRARDLPAGAVLVVGSAQSGVQIAEDLVAEGRVVYLCTSSVGRARRRYRGRDMFEWLAQAGFFDRTPDQLPEPRTRFPANPQTSGVGPLGHTVSLQSLAALGVTLLGRPRSITGDRLLLDDTLGANIAFGDRISADLKGLA